MQDAGFGSIHLQTPPLRPESQHQQGPDAFAMIQTTRMMLIEENFNLTDIKPGAEGTLVVQKNLPGPIGKRITQP